MSTAETLTQEQLQALVLTKAREWADHHEDAEPRRVAYVAKRAEKEQLSAQLETELESTRTTAQQTKANAIVTAEATRQKTVADKMAEHEKKVNALAREEGKLRLLYYTSRSGYRSAEEELKKLFARIRALDTV